MPWALIGQFIAKHWRWFAIGAAVIATFIAFQVIEHQRDEARREAELATAQRNEIKTRLEVSNASLDRVLGEVEEQNAAIADLAINGQARIAEGQRAIMDEVRRGTKAQTVAKELNREPTQSAEQSKTSERVMQNRDLL